MIFVLNCIRKLTKRRIKVYIMKKLSTFDITSTAIFAALLCVLAPLSLPIGPIPISLATLIIYLAATILAPKLSTMSVVVYILLGLVGLPVFSGYAGGVGKLVGPTGGYIIGYIPMAFIAGYITFKFIDKKYMAVAGMVAGTAVLYLIGTIWFVIQMKCEVGYALSVCVVPFLLGDAIKIVVATVLGIAVRERLVKAGIIK